MKKYIILLAVAATALFASCAKNETATVASQEITYKAVMHKNLTKAPIDGAYYSLSCPEFLVYAYYNDEDSTFPTSCTTYIDGATVSPNSTDEIWESDPVAYWPLSGSLTFVAVTPATVDASYAEDDQTWTITDYEISGQDDVMYSIADDATALTANGKNYKPAADTDAKTTKGVAIKFRHALSQVIFKAKTADDYDDLVEFTITSLKLLEMGSKATMTAEEDDACSWDIDETDDQDVTVDEDTVDSTTAIQVNDEGLLVFPITFTADTEQIEITYTMTYNGVDAGEATKTIDLKTADLEGFEPGKKYVLTLILGVDEIKYAPEVIDWVDGDSEDYEF